MSAGGLPQGAGWTASQSVGLLHKYQGKHDQSVESVIVSRTANVQTAPAPPLLTYIGIKHSKWRSRNNPAPRDNSYPYMPVSRLTLIRPILVIPIGSGRTASQGYKTCRISFRFRYLVLDGKLRAPYHNSSVQDPEPRHSSTASDEAMESHQKRVHWHLLQAWVEQKQAYEAQHDGQPAPVTAEEEKAMAPLMRLLAPVRGPAPDLGEENWIGKLQGSSKKRSWPG